MCRIGHMQKHQVEDRFITIRILRELHEKVNIMVGKTGIFTNSNDFISEAIREKLERVKR